MINKKSLSGKLLTSGKKDVDKYDIQSNESYLDEISYSMCIEKKIVNNKDNNPLKYTLPRKTHGWVDDNTVSSCYNCDAEFKWSLRRHHCRLCGKIFCWKCTNYQDIIPNDLLSEDSKKVSWNVYLSSYIVTVDLNRYRVCITCHNLIGKVNSVKKLTEVFKIIELDIKELKKVGKVCKVWLNAANYYLSKFREIQYKLPFDKYTQWEKDMLWFNLKYCGKHSKYILHLLKICETSDDVKKVVTMMKDEKTINCWCMMCSRGCRETLTSFDAIDILAHGFGLSKAKNSNDSSNVVKMLICIGLDHLLCDDKEFKCYIPFLVYNIIYDKDEIIANYLINRCFNNFILLNALYWELQLYIKTEFGNDNYTKLYNKLKQFISDDDKKDKFVVLLQGNNFIRAIESISKAIYLDNKKYDEIKENFGIKYEMVLPLNPNIKVTKLFIEKIKVKNSATRPIIVPCQTNDEKIFNIMHKNESVRKDQQILNIIALLEMIVKAEEDIDLESVAYNILPTSRSSGLVEIIDNSDTIYFVQEKLQSSILNYILENNDGLKINELRKKFIKTTALYSVITYLLGVGDRHLDNIMITKDGRLFHIDFDYILGNDPVFNSNGIRITHEMIEAVGGYNSKYYTEFKDICTKIYNCARRNINIFMHMINLIPKVTDVKLTEEEIMQQIIRRFIPGENDIIAELHLVSKLEKQSCTDKIKDWCHYHSKEKTLGNAFNLASGVLSNAVSSLRSLSGTSIDISKS